MATLAIFRSRSKKGGAVRCGALAAAFLGGAIERIG
jgi:hypothetical protein